ncbi:MAG TPA: glycosyltransferase [Candidatus Krumholzibacteria bacterium]|nr:glycosyltransferase [Candidatus Krumholzibacteria bacterium]
MKKLLVIAYFFPPSGAVGVYRTLKFVKYLPEFGWEPVVLTVSNGKTPVYDESLMKLIPEGVQVHRVPSWEALNEGFDSPAPPVKTKTIRSRLHTRLYLLWHTLALPDVKLGWVPNATRAARRLIREEGIHHVYISGFPFSSFLIGPRVKRGNDVRVAIDYRDPWTQSITYPLRTALHRRVDRALEQRVVSASDLVISNTRYNEQQMVAGFGGGMKREKFVSIHNGFDAADFASTPHGRNQQFTITYAGAFYHSVGSSHSDRAAGDEVMKTYSPLVFFEALQAFFARRPEAKARTRVRFMGVLGQGYDPLIRERGLDGVIERLGYIDYDEHLRVLKQSDALLLVMSRGEKSRGWIPSKFFQYLGTGNPVLALAPEGEVRDILTATRGGICVEPDDVAGASRALETLYEGWVNGTAIAQPDASAVAAYERRNLTAKLARALDSM